MKKFAFAVLLFAAAVAMAQSPFDGKWKIDTSKGETPKKPDQYNVSNGRFSCPSCNPKIDIKADGTDQKRAGSPYEDTMSAKVIDDRNLETQAKKGDKVVSNAKYKVSDDNNTLTLEWSYLGSANGQPANGTLVYKRVGAAPSSGSQVTGQWQAQQMQSLSDAAGTFTFKGSGSGLTYTAGTGETYTANLDGKDYPYRGDPGTTSVALKQIDDRTIEETDKRNGKPIVVSRMSVSADGKTMDLAIDDKLQNQQWKWVAQKQE